VCLVLLINCSCKTLATHIISSPENRKALQQIEKMTGSERNGAPFSSISTTREIFLQYKSTQSEDLSEARNVIEGTCYKLVR
jgi:hypothetical protein